jgi:DnaA family protein
MPGRGSKHLKKIIMPNPKQLTFPWERTFKSSFDGFFCDNKNTDLVNNLRLIEGDDIFIYGPSNIGKTYLLQALASFYSDLNKSSLYIPLSDIKNYDTNIIDGTHEADLVCVDSVDEIAGIMDWEVALFNLINNASLTNCRLVFSASINVGTPNFSLPDLDSRIRKLDSYEMFSVQDNNLNRALMHIAHSRSINLGEREANYLLSYTKRNLSDLVGIIERLDSLSMELKRKITIPLIKDSL